MRAVLPTTSSHKQRLHAGDGNHGARFVDTDAASLGGGAPPGFKVKTPNFPPGIVQPQPRRKLNAGTKMNAHPAPSFNQQAVSWGRPPRTQQPQPSRELCTFIPLSQNDENPFPRFTPPSSPYDFKKTASPSPSMMSMMTAETVDSSFSYATTVTPRMSPISPTDSIRSRAFRSPSPQDMIYYHAVDSSFAAQSPVAPKPRPSSRLEQVSKSNALKTESPAEDSARNSRLKTEICMHYAAGNECPWGANCTYAHGEEELQLTTLLEWHRAGLIDVETHRTMPCLTWVMTGGCPFGIRCVGIHDPRVAGAHASWLPHTETQGNTLDTDINVDALHQKRLYTVLHGNPFGAQFSLEFHGWDELQKLVCNTAILKRRRNSISEIHKISIALHMRGKPGFHYKFLPLHVIYDKPCMVLNKKAFRLTNGGNVVEIPLRHYNPRYKTHVLVREIAFGPDADPSVDGVSLWFNVPEKEVTYHTPQQAKRFRWKNKSNKPSKEGRKGKKGKRQSPFDTHECFFMIRPEQDPEAYDLATKILENRLAFLKTERLSQLSDRFAALKDIAAEEEKLKQEFAKQRAQWISWAWPVNKGRTKVDVDTPLPPIDGTYEFACQECKTRRPEAWKEEMLGDAVAPIWESFVGQLSSKSKQKDVELLLRGLAPKRRRLAVFEQLAAGRQICPNRTLPHILDSQIKPIRAKGPQSMESERCWKDLLLTSKDAQKTNEWDLVAEHFEKSRSSKTLEIVQSQKQ